MLGPVLNKENSLCHLILTTHYNASIIPVDTRGSPFTQSSFQSPYSIASPRASYITLAFSDSDSSPSPGAPIQLLSPTLNLLAEPAPRILTSHKAPSLKSPLRINYRRGPLASFISSASFLLGPLPHTGGPFSFPPRVRPLGTANGSAPAQWDPHPNCSRAPQSVVVRGLSRSHTRTLCKGSRKWKRRERGKGEGERKEVEEKGRSWH